MGFHQGPSPGIVLVRGGWLSTSGKLSPCTVHGIPVCPAVPLKAQLWLVCDRCGTSALCRLSHPDQSHQSNLGTSGCHGAHPIPWVTGVTQTMFLLCHQGCEKVLSRHRAARAKAPLPLWGGTAVGLFEQLFHSNQSFDSVMGVQGYSTIEWLSRTH